MINIEYLKGLDYHPMGFPGVYLIQHHSKPDSSRVVCSHSDGKLNKDGIFSVMRMFGQNELRNEWDFHHIVERKHYSDIDFTGNMRWLYNNRLPCVLINKTEEHHIYNTVFRSTDTDILYRDRTLPKTVSARSEYANRDLQTSLGRKRLIARIDGLRKLYHNFYGSDYVLRTISNNVFDVAESLLKKLS